MKELFETYAGVIIAAIVTAAIIAGIILLFATGDGSSSEGALHQMIVTFFRSISG